MWHAFGNLGHWTEWHAMAPNMRSAVDMAKPKVRTYCHAFIEGPRADLVWFMSTPVGFSNREYVIHPYKPLQSDWGVASPLGD